MILEIWNTHWLILTITVSSIKKQWQDVKSSDFLFPFIFLSACAYSTVPTADLGEGYQERREKTQTRETRQRTDWSRRTRGLDEGRQIPEEVTIAHEGVIKRQEKIAALPLPLSLQVTPEEKREKRWGGECQRRGNKLSGAARASYKHLSSGVQKMDSPVQWTTQLVS